MCRPATLALAVFVAAGCVASVRRDGDLRPCRPSWLCVHDGAPRLSFPFASARRSLRFEIDPAIADAFELQGDPILRTEVRAFRRTLDAGFVAGFRPAFPTPNGDAPADLTLRLRTAQLSLVSVEMGAFQQLLSARADLRYDAVLLDGEGHELRRSSGIAASRSFPTHGRDVTDGAVAAIERMFQAIEHDCFGPFERLATP